jgi:inner membrane protein
MDNLTHTLVGVALSRSGLGKYCPRAGLLLIIAANIPDIDMVSMIQGQLRGLEIHRGYTHSLIGLPFMAALAVASTALFGWRKLPWRVAWLIACVGVGTHLLLDWSMSYGIRLFLPFSSRWLYLDLFSLTDWVMLAVLLLALAAPFLNRLVSEEIGDRSGSGRGFALAALLFIVVYGGVRGVLHQRALSQLQSRVYADLGPPLQLAALPNSLNPFSWTGIVQGEHAYRLYTVPALGQFDPTAGAILYQSPWNPALQAASDTAPFRYVLYFSRFPYWKKDPISSEEQLQLITLSDLRYGSPGESFVTVKALLDLQNRVQDVGFGPGALTSGR